MAALREQLQQMVTQVVELVFFTILANIFHIHRCRRQRRKLFGFEGFLIRQQRIRYGRGGRAQIPQLQLNNVTNERYLIQA